MKVFVWFASRDPSDYGQSKQFVKIYVVASDLAEARRRLDEVLPKQGTNVAFFRMALQNTEPVVFNTPFTEVNISDGREAKSIVYAEKMV